MGREMVDKMPRSWRERRQRREMKEASMVLV